MNSVQLIGERIQYLKSKFNNVLDRRELGYSSDLFERLVLMERLKDDLLDFQSTEEKNSVFISGSIASQHERNILYRARDIGEDEFNLRVYLGVDPGDYPNPLEMAHSRIENSRMFMSIMLPRYAMTKSVGGEQLFAPSVWISEEKGIALGLNKVVVCVCDQSIGSEYAASTLPNQFVHRFDQNDLLNVELEIRNGFRALIDRHISQGMLVKDFQKLRMFEE